MRAAIILGCVGFAGLLAGTLSLHAQGNKGEKKAEPPWRVRAREGARLEFKAKMAAMQAEVEAALAGEREAEHYVKCVNQLLGQGAASEEDYRSAMLTLVAMRLERAELEKRLKLMAKDMPAELRPKK